MKTSKIYREINNQNITDGKIPFFDKFFIDDIRWTADDCQESYGLTFGKYMCYLERKIKLYKRAIKKRYISKNIDFETFLTTGNNADIKRLNELKEFMCNVNVTLTTKGDEKDEE